MQSKYHMLTNRKNGRKEANKRGRKDEGMLTFDQSISIAMTKLTNQIVEMTGKTRQTASLCLGVWMETLKRSLRGERGS